MEYPWQTDTTIRTYSERSLASLSAWALQLQNENLTLSGLSGTLYSPRESPWRLDKQGEFTRPGPLPGPQGQVTWINLQIQENKPRARGASTTVMAIYVHKQGYEQGMTWQIIARHIYESTLPNTHFGDITIYAIDGNLWYHNGKLEVREGSHQGIPGGVRMVPRSVSATKMDDIWYPGVSLKAPRRTHPYRDT